MRQTAITQIALVGISIVIIVTFIRPTFASIRTLQDEIYQYADATAKANEFNTLLQQLLARERSFSSDDKKALEMFLPTEIDPLAVMHDLQLVVSSHGGQVTNIKADKLVLPNTDVDFEDYFEEQVVTAERFVTQDFRLSFKADYPSFTTILKALESTAYVIQIDKLDFGKIVDATEKGNPGVDADDLEVALTIKVYALAPAKATN